MIQKFEIGDEVAVLDEALSGKVVGVNAAEISIETTDGFLMKFSENELVKVNKSSTLSGFFSTQSFVRFLRSSDGTLIRLKLFVL